VASVETIDHRLAAASRCLRECSEQAEDNGAVGLLSRALENGLRRHQWRLKKEQDVAQQRLDVVRAEYTARVRDLRTLQRLRERRRAEWSLEQQRAEQHELDELARLCRAARDEALGSASEGMKDEA
jgi:flagellar export protein FliJ